MNLAAILGCFIVSVVNVYAQKEKGGLSTVRNVSKALIIPSLLFVYVCFAQTVQPLLVAALIAGWFGDIFLMIPSKPSDSEGSPMFAAGLLSFLAGHICYIILLLRLSDGLPGNQILLVFLYLPYLLLGVAMVNGLKVSSLLLNVGVVLYTLCLAFMSYAAMMWLIAIPSIGPLLTFVGSLFFISSDGVLSLKKLGGKKNMSEGFIMGTYITAQLLIVLGFLL